jgi:hypothetical protein
MLTYVRAFSLVEAEHFIRGQHPDARELVRRHQGRIAWVGVSGWEPSPVVAYKGPRIVESFKDVNADERPGFPFEGRMQPEQAARLAAFVHRFAIHEQPWALLVHCVQGLHRSVAVAHWARARYGVTQPNPAWAPAGKPNPYILRLLTEAGSQSGQTPLETPGFGPLLVKSETLA